MTEPMTVGELRKLLAMYSDETPVFVLNDEWGDYSRPCPMPVSVAERGKRWDTWDGRVHGEKGRINGISLSSPDT